MLILNNIFTPRDSKGILRLKRQNYLFRMAKQMVIGVYHHFMNQGKVVCCNHTYLSKLFALY